MKLRVEDVSFNYAGCAPVLRGVNLQADGGEVLGLLGPNGSGKTTLLRLMTGSIAPTAGRVTLGGQDIDAFRPRALAKVLAFVPQSASPPDGFTALDVALMGRNAHIPRFAQESAQDISIARDAMRRTGVEALSESLASEISGGEWQRLLIARALAQQPQTLLLDEPVSNLDVRHQLETMRLLRALAGDGIAVVCVMHDINLAARFCDRIAVLHAGTLKADGAPQEVLTEALLYEVYGVRGTVTRGAYVRFEPD